MKDEQQKSFGQFVDELDGGGDPVGAGGGCHADPWGDQLARGANRGEAVAGRVVVGAHRMPGQRGRRLHLCGVGPRLQPPAGGDQLDKVVRVCHRGRVHRLQQRSQFGARCDPLEPIEIRPAGRVATASGPRTRHLEHAFESRGDHRHTAAGVPANAMSRRQSARPRRPPVWRRRALLRRDLDEHNVDA